MQNFLKNHKLFLLILLGGFILRTFWYKELFYFAHDQDLLSWMIRDILENRHLRLIGQETSQLGVFIGPLYYYSMIPFYILVSMDPIGGVFASIIFGLITVASFYFVLKEIFNKQVGLIGSTIYAFSLLTVMTDREVNPTTIVMLWSVWFLYAVWCLWKGKQKWGFIISGILLGTIWHLNLALALLTPLLPLALYFSKKKLHWKYIVYGLIPLILFSIPLIAFEMRHDFQQAQSIISSFSSKKEVAFVETTGLGKLDRVLQLVTKNVNRLIYGEPQGVPNNLLFIVSLFTLGFLLYKKKLHWQLGLMFILWLIFFVTFFTINPINVSEYYLNGMNVVWITLISLGLYQLIQNKKLKRYGFIAIGLFILLNCYYFFSQPFNRSGYIERKQVAAFIKEDSLVHNYPCVSVSYITKPGYELGYRYLFYLEDLHVNQPSSGSPVYTIVFPHSMVTEGEIDKTFGSLGMILPEYEKYDEESVTISCSGENANLTDPMFGYTE